MIKKILMILIAAIVFTSEIFAADGVVVTQKNLNSGKGAWVITVSWTAAAAGTKADYNFTTSNSGSEAWIIDALIATGYYLYAVRTIPGTTAPAADYDININDENSVDILFSKLDDRSATAAEEVTAYNVAKAIDSNLIIQWGSVTNANCTGKVILFFAKYE